jgi:hypothetical protein
MIDHKDMRRNYQICGKEKYLNQGLESVSEPETFEYWESEPHLNHNLD